MSDRPNVPLPPPKPLTPDEIAAYLDWHLAELIRRRDEEIIPGLARMAREYTDAEDAGRAAENAKMARALVTTARNRHREEKESYIAGGRAVDGWLARFLAPLLAGIGPVEQQLLAFTNRAAEAERKRREEIAQQAADEANRRITEAAKAAKRNPLGTDVSEKLERAATAAHEAERTQQEALAKPAELGRVRGIYGGVASPKTTWEFEVVDFAAVPPEYKRLDDAKVNAAKAQRDPLTKRPVAVIPGIRWVEVRSVGGAKVRV